MSENVHQSGQHSPLRDDDLARQERTFHQEGHTPRAEDRYDEEPVTEERGGTPDGMTRADVDLRSGIAQVLGTDAFPGDRERLLGVAAGNHAPDWVIDKLRSLPPSEDFENVQDVARTLGIGVETHRN